MTRRYKNRFDRAMRDENWGSFDGEEIVYTDNVPKRFRRNKIDGVLGGVCAGIGDYTGVDPVIVRILTVVTTFMTGGTAFWVYLGLWIFVPSDKRAPYKREAREAYRAHRNAPEAPARTASFKDVKSKFRSVETRLQDLERSITSSEWQLRRKFRDLEN